MRDILNKVTRLSIPAVGHEDHQWTVDADGPYSRAERTRGSGPYRSTVPSPIANYRPEFPMDLASDLDNAIHDLVTFDSHVAVKVLR